MADISITPANVLPISGTQRKGTAATGETITAGMAVRDVGGLVYRAQANTVANAAASGIALNGASPGQPVTYQTDGTIAIGGTVAIGTVYGVTDTAGGIGPIDDRANPDVLTILGVGATVANITLLVFPTGVTIPA